MELRDICQTTVATISAEENVQKATWAMREDHVGDLVVVEQHEDGQQIPRGILTDRDIVVDLLAEGVRDLDSVRIGDAMSDKLIMANYRDAPDDALETMQVNGIRRLPVVDDDGALFGIVTLDDMISFLTHQMAALGGVVGTEIRQEVDKDRAD